MKVLVFPRDENPYQDSLYAAMDPRRFEMRYLDGPTTSQTANLIALPLLLVWFRLRGFRLLHVHWVHPFLVTWARSDRTRGLVQRGFELFLALANALGYRIVWTAHNLMPHVPVFRDDVAARQVLMARSAAVIAHTAHTARQLEARGAEHVVVVPQGADHLAPTSPADRDDARRAIGLDPARTMVLFFGKVLAYKGVDLLLDAVASLPASVEIDVVVVGLCRDEALRADLEARSTRAGERAHTRFEFVPDAELAGYLDAADLAAFPFRAVTNSSSVATAMGARLPVIVPRLAVLDDLPADATVRYEPGPEGLADALTRAASFDVARLAGLRAGADRFAARRTWSAAAAATRAVYAEVLACPHGTSSPAATTAAESDTAAVLR